jgi:hypothetical protein
MKTVKSLLLGSAAGFVAISGAQAADLPMAEPVEYVKVCSTYGEGFFYIPGTDTCLQISGKARADFFVLDDEFSTDGGTTYGEDSNNFETDIRGVIAADARSETEWGTLRAYIEFEGRSRSGLRPNGRGDVNADDNGSGDDIEGPGVQLISAFVQFAGVTAGMAPSFYDFVEFDTINDFWSKEDVNTLAYTASFGSGFAATIAIEDKDFRADDSGSPDQVWPNIVAALRIDQAWGSAQISGAVQDNEGDNPVTADPADDTGWAVQAGIAFNLPIANEGSKIFLQGAYTEGAMSYAGGEDFTGNFGNSVGLSVNDQTGGVNNELFLVGGGLGLQLSETVRSTIIAAYYEYDDATFDVEGITAEGNIFWTPVDNLDIGIGIIYSDYEASGAGAAGAFDVDGGTSDTDGDAWTGVLRIERGF